YNNGLWFYNLATGNWGLEWPKGSNLSPVFAAGQWLSAKVNGDLKVSAVEYAASEFQPGRIIAPDSAADPQNYQYRWYVIKSDGSGNWSDWPVHQGAPVTAAGMPRLQGDITAFSLWNDLAPHHIFQNNNPLNAEIRQTAWQYSEISALQDVTFLKWQITNKSGKPWDSTYFAIWLDLDIGSSIDDLHGSDTLRNLGFAYNMDNDDSFYGMAPPAAGFDFLQGPIIDQPGSVVQLPNGTLLQNKAMLFLTAAVFYEKGMSMQANPQTARHVWQYMNALWKDGSPITYGGDGTNPTAPPTRFMFTGDPFSGAGWLEPASMDRRALLITGPFDMPPWQDSNTNGLPDFGEPGVQEVVVSALVSKELDNLFSVRKLKRLSDLVQDIYDADFDFVQKPAKPEISASGLPGKVVLTWDNRSEYNPDGTLYSATHEIFGMMYGDSLPGNPPYPVADDTTYNFYGYSVYQYADAAGSDPVLVSHWDVGKIKKPVSYNHPHFIEISENYHPAAGQVGAPLQNGKPYYFGVTAEAYLMIGAPPVIKSDADRITAIPLGGVSGFNYSTVNSDSLAQHLTGLSFGQVFTQVVDPTKVTGHTYQVHFKTIQNALRWNLYDVTDGDTVLFDQTSFNKGNASTIYKGVMIKIINPSNGILKVVQVDPNDWGLVLDDNLNLNPNYLFAPQDPRFFLTAQGVQTAPENLQRWNWRENFTNDVVIEFVASPQTDGQIVLSGWTNAPNPATNTWFMEGWRESTLLGGSLNTIGGARLPFNVWLINDSSQATQVNAMILDDDDDFYWNIYHDTPLGTQNGFERIFITTYPYDEAELLADGGNNVLNNIIWSSLWDSGHNLGRLIIGTLPYTAGPHLGQFSGLPPSPGSVIRFVGQKPLTPNDLFEFTTTAPQAYSSIKGDVTLDSLINITDVVYLMNNILGTRNFSGAQEYAADYNSDLLINVADLVGVINYILGRTAPQPVRSATETVTVSLPEQFFTEEGVARLPLLLESEYHPAALQVEINYDPAVVKPIAPLLQGNSIHTFSSRFSDNGKGKALFLIYNIDGKQFAPEDAPLLQFEILDADAANSTFELAEAVLATADGKMMMVVKENTTARAELLPAKFILHNNYPNPFNPVTHISFQLPRDVKVDLEIFNILGQRVKTLLDNQYTPAGRHILQWDGRNNRGVQLSSGVYILRIQAADYVAHKKLILLK
ncbi:MAG: T9SS type A sorting domain-containing protein, partial [Calditrichia bacterium]